MKQILTESILESLRTPAGGYDRRTLSLLGIGWPPYKRWKKNLVGTLIDSDLLFLIRNHVPKAPQSQNEILPRTIHNIDEAKELVKELTLKKLGLD